MRPLSVPTSGSTYESVKAARGLQRLRLRARGWAYRSRVRCAIRGHKPDVPTYVYAMHRPGEPQIHQPMDQYNQCRCGRKRTSLD
jgi:hypothetical protein